MLFSNGDLTPFSLTLEREGEGRSVTSQATIRARSKRSR